MLLRRRISHVFIMDVPSHGEPLLITDAAINIFPDLETKRDIIQNAIDLCNDFMPSPPRVAILSAVETVTVKIPSTIDAAALCKMAERVRSPAAWLTGLSPSTTLSIPKPRGSRASSPRSQGAPRSWSCRISKPETCWRRTSPSC